jgi:hypothetical protein
VTQQVWKQSVARNFQQAQQIRTARCLWTEFHATAKLSKAASPRHTRNTTLQRCWKLSSAPALVEIASPNKAEASARRRSAFNSGALIATSDDAMTLLNASTQGSAVGAAPDLTVAATDALRVWKSADAAVSSICGLDGTHAARARDCTIAGASGATAAHNTGLQASI